MVEVYNHYLGGYLPKMSAKYAVHKKHELKSIYSRIITLNRNQPLAMVDFSDSKQAYVLDVKEMSMEMKAAISDALDSENGSVDSEKIIEESISVFNRLLKRSDEFGESVGRKSRPGSEMRALVSEFEGEITEHGLQIDENGFLSKQEGVEVTVPSDFFKALKIKSEQMNRNPMEYLEKRICSYAFLTRKNVGVSYTESMYSGMLFNSYC